jgi:hypothetical protein
MIIVRLRDSSRGRFLEVQSVPDTVPSVLLEVCLYRLDERSFIRGNSNFRSTTIQPRAINLVAMEEN